MLITLLASSAYSQSIDIVLHPNDPGCTAAEVGSTPWIELHVIANLGGDVTGFAGTQFRVTGFPATWNPSNVVWSLDTSTTIAFGNPLFSGVSDANWDNESGTVVAWNSCQTQGMQRIGKIILLGAPTGENITLQVTPFYMGSHEELCVSMNRCDNPYYSRACVTGGSFTLNGQGSSNCTPTAVALSSWSAVKSLYQ
jgi:hypothetical protein